MHRITTMAAAVCVAAGTALAQQPEQQPAGGGGGGIGMNIAAAREKATKKIDPPTLSLKSEEGATWGLIATILFAGGCLLAAIIPPKRGHQD